MSRPLFLLASVAVAAAIVFSAISLLDAGARASERRVVTYEAARTLRVESAAGAVRVVGAGGTAIDPEVVSQILTRRRRASVLDELTAREREVLGLMAEGHTNAAIAERLVVTGGAVEKHIGNVFMKLGLPQTEQHHRRVLAVLTYLGA